VYLIFGKAKKERKISSAAVNTATDSTTQQHPRKPIIITSRRQQERPSDRFLKPNRNPGVTQWNNA